jgi:hypothetical protein
MLHPPFSCLYDGCFGGCIFAGFLAKPTLPAKLNAVRRRADNNRNFIIF